MRTVMFRFMAVHSPQEVDPSLAGKNSVNLNSYPTDLVAELVKQNQAGSLNGMLMAIQGYRKTNNAGFIDSRQKVDQRFLTLHEVLAGLRDAGFLQASKNAFSRVFDNDVHTFIAGKDFRDLFVRVTNSIVIAAIDPSVTPQARALLAGLAQTLGLIQKLAEPQDYPAYTNRDFRTQLIVVPEGIFPLPVKGQDVTQLLQPEQDRRDKISQNQAKRIEMSQDLAAHRAAVQDLVTTFEKSQGRCQTTPPPPSGSCGFLLSETDVNQLGDGTKAVLKKNGFDLSRLDVAVASTHIDKQSHRLGRQLYSSSSAARYMVNLGNVMVPSEVVLGVWPVEPDPASTPGACPPAPSGGMTSEVTVPTEFVKNKAALVINCADLMLVEQELLRYELGEIAHIENVLKSEVRDRHFTTKTTTDVSTLTETETIDDKTKDLSSTERFELQTESEKVINENSAVQAGVTVNASYGPSVDVTANFNYSHTNASQESARASTNFSRDTTSRASSRIQKRTLERQFRRTISLVEEFNKHSFDNKEGQGNITGVYRFVDKVYAAQILNYGKRMMLEFMVPEPAAFLRFARTKQPLGAVTQVEPDPPGYCINNVFVSLQPKDIDRDNYLYWVGKYNAEDAAPPPVLLQILSGSKISDSPGQKSNVTKDIYSTWEVTDLNVPDGYRPVLADLTINGWNVSTSDVDYPHSYSLQVQKQIFYNDTVFSINLAGLVANRVPVAVVTKNYESISIVVNIACVLTDEKFQEWQIKTFNSIMNAYNDQQSRYNNAIQTARLQASDSLISGSNPAINRETEKIELKKGCITLLTQQNYELFDAMKRNAAPFGYPEVAFADAEAEGRFIQFFENAFEWTNMLYIFYPYFWGSKADWATISQIEDDDPVFTRFLQAGSARVQVPVRPGFDTSVGMFLAGLGIWKNDRTLVNSQDGQLDPLFLSVLDELKEQLGNQDIEGVGKLDVTHNSPQVTGVGTQFTTGDENKRILIRGKTYTIKQVSNQTAILLTRPWQDATETGVGYSIGPRLVGEPWEVRLPTDLVILDQNNNLSAINDGIEAGRI